MALTPEITAEVLRKYQQNPRRFTPVKVARSNGISVREVNEIIAENRIVGTPTREHSGGRGRPDLQGFIVAGRRVTDAGWNNNDPSVQLARQQFCAGTHTMATHRDGPFLYLCSIPLRRPLPARPHYFSPKVS